MLDTAEKSKRITKSLWNFAKGFTLLLTYEVIEELLEEAIAWTITTVVARAISFLVVVLLTQTTKVTIKGLAKGLTVLLKPLVKKITYKAGNDKIDKIRRMYKTMKDAISKLFSFIARNKKSLLATILSFFGCAGAGGGVDLALILSKYDNLPLYAYVLIGIGVLILFFVPIFFGIKGAGYETPEQESDRLAKEEAKKQEKQRQKEQEEKARAEQEEMLKLYEAEEANKKLADEEAREAELAKQREEEEKRKEQANQFKFQQLLREYEDAKAQGFEGTFKDFIANKK